MLSQLELSLVLFDLQQEEMGGGEIKECITSLTEIAQYPCHLKSFPH